MGNRKVQVPKMTANIPIHRTWWQAVLAYVQ